MAAAFCALVLAQAAIARAQVSVGTVAKLTGTARLLRGRTESAVTQSMPVEQYDRFQTGAKSTVTIALADGTSLELGEASSITIERYPATGKSGGLISLWVGRLRSIVKAALAGGGDFEVHTPNAVAAVRGTDFETKFVLGKPCPEDHSCMRYTTVGVSSGKVAVSNPSEPAASVLVTDGYETTVACESPPTSPAPLGMNEMGAPGYH